MNAFWRVAGPVLGLAILASPTSALVWEDNGHEYVAVLSKPGITWEEANKEATAMGGYLATLTTADENKWVYSEVVFPKFGSGNGGADGVQAWLGGYRLKPQLTEGGAVVPSTGWAWVTGEAWDYTNWHQYEPNNAGGSEDGLTINRFGDWTWNDEGAWVGGVTGFVVEFENKRVPDAGGTLVLLGMGLVACGWASRRK